MVRTSKYEPHKCRGCNAEVLIIKTGTYYKNVLVEVEPIRIRQQTNGEAFVTADGRVIFGRQAGDADDDPDTEFLWAYIPHKGRCPNNGRAPRVRNRPSGYR